MSGHFTIPKNDVVFFSEICLGTRQTYRNPRYDIVNQNKPAICVFCGSTSGNNPHHAEAAATLGRQIAEAGFRLVFGGGGHGLMGEVARAAHRAAGAITGIMPDCLRAYELPAAWEHELILTPDLPQRKVQMMDDADAFVVLPGGAGTLDEFFEVVTSANLGLLPKPIVVISVDGYFAPLESLMRHMAAEGFMAEKIFARYRTVATVQEAMALIAAALD
jgi:uncharacterized protein (TIGR00730 family)